LVRSLLVGSRKRCRASGYRLRELRPDRLAPTVTGFIVKASGSFVPALLTGAVIAVVAAVLYMALIDQPIPAADLAKARPAFEG